jgi:hypothetical protein
MARLDEVHKDAARGDVSAPPGGERAPARPAGCVPSKGGRAGPRESLAAVRAQAVASIQRAFPTWHVEQAAKQFVAERGDDRVATPDLWELKARLIAAEQAHT